MTKLSAIIKKIFVNLIVLSFFVTTLLYSLASVYGYRINTEEIKLEQLGVLDLTHITPRATVYIDGQKHYQETPCTVYDLSLTDHDLNISLKGHQDWSKEIKIKKGYVTKIGKINLIPIFDNEEVNVFQTEVDLFSFDKSSEKFAIYREDLNQINLINTNGINEKSLSIPFKINDLKLISNNLFVSDKENVWWKNSNYKTWEKIDERNGQEVINPDKKLKIVTDNNEIWINEISNNKKTLFSRLSSEVIWADWFSSDQIIFSVSNTVRICDLDKENCHNIYNHDKGTTPAIWQNKLYLINAGDLVVLKLKQENQNLFGQIFGE